MTAEKSRARRRGVAMGRAERNEEIVVATEVF